MRYISSNTVKMLQHGDVLHMPQQNFSGMQMCSVCPGKFFHVLEGQVLPAAINLSSSIKRMHSVHSNEFFISEEGGVCSAFP